MRARIDIVSIGVDTDFDDVIKIILVQDSQIPVYDGNIDQIKEYYIKDFKYLNKKIQLEKCN